MIKAANIINTFRNYSKLFRKIVIQQSVACRTFPTHILPNSSHSSVYKRYLSITNAKCMVKKKPKIIEKIKPKAKTIKIWRNMTVADLAKTSNRSLEIDDLKAIHEIGKKLGFRCQLVNAPGTEKFESIVNKDAVKRSPADPKDMIKRPPVVTIMGHVDHGKTTLLDSLRKTSVVKEEFGGITQHIGAFSVKLPNGNSITFLDTPGHAAFSAMRARGAQATDIVVLVVAADDGVMEQTVESIKFANDAKVPMIVAINKIDKPKIDIEYTKKGLIANGVQLEDMGGEVQSVEISAATGQNLPHLLESILTLAEVLEIKGDPKGLVEGVVLESKMDKGRGKLATILVQRGTLKKGRFITAGLAWGKVRSMFDEWGKTLELVSPGMPAQVIGWKELPAAGDVLLEVENEKRAKEVVDYRTEVEKEEKQKSDLPEIQRKLDEHLITYKADLEERKSIGKLRRKKKIIFREKEIVESDHPKLEIVIKGDVDGSVEAIMDIIDTYQSHQACELDIIHYGVGEVTETDIDLAETFNGIVYAFNVHISPAIKKLAEEKKVEIKDFNIIYKLIDNLKEEISKKLPPLDKEEIIGEANVLQEFIVTEGKKKVPVAGCRCTKGILKRYALFRLVRGEEIVHEGPLESMRHIKNEVESIKKEVECGLRLKDGTVRFQGNDILICYEIVKIDQKTDWDPGF